MKNTADTAPLHVEIRVRNNRMLKARKALGFTQGEMAEFSGVSKHAYARLEVLADSPFGVDGDWRDVAKKVAAAVGENPEWVFSDDVRSIENARVFRECDAESLQLASARWVGQQPELPDEMYSRVELAETTRTALATLTPREATVLRMRFGIDEDSDHTLDEVGEQFEVNRERIRQIEAKALRKLRHPSRATQLKAAMFGSIPCVRCGAQSVHGDLCRDCRASERQNPSAMVCTHPVLHDFVIIRHGVERVRCSGCDQTSAINENLDWAWKHRTCPRCKAEDVAWIVCSDECLDRVRKRAQRRAAGDEEMTA